MICSLSAHLYAPFGDPYPNYVTLFQSDDGKITSDLFWQKKLQA